MIELRGVSKQYHGTTVVHPLDWQLTTGKTHVLIGPSGCGKSTLLRLMMHLIKPDEGQVLFDSTALNERNIADVRHRIGYVIQDGGLFPHLSARRNATLLPQFLQWSADRMQQRVDELRQLVQLPADALDRFPGQLSGGQRQRVSLMRALMPDPDVLLLDEPLGALDPLIRADLQQQLREIFRTLGKTVVLVTHDLAEAAYFADQIVLLRKGDVIQQGTIEDLTKHPADPFVSEFVQAQQVGWREELA